MNSTSIEFTDRAAPAATAAARSVLGLLSRIEVGALELQLPGGASARFGQGTPGASVRVSDWNVFARALRSGDIGFAEGFIAGDWDSPDLTALLTLLIANRDRLERVVYGRWWGSLLHRAKHLLNRNSRRGSAKNIHAHYDLGNAFYRLWLDPTMNYSSAWFDGDFAQPLAQAQHAKLRRALRAIRRVERLAPARDRLRLGRPGRDRRARVRCARHRRHAVREQLALAREQRTRGLDGRILEQDYRGTKGATPSSRSRCSRRSAREYGHLLRPMTGS